MPTLPSGRRVEYSLDRFHALLRLMDDRQAQRIAENMRDPDDLLFVLDAVHFSVADGSPYFAGYVAADWKAYAADWSTADRDTLQAWLFSPEARARREEAINYIKSLIAGRLDLPYPYALAGDAHPPGSHPGSTLRQ